MRRSTSRWLHDRTGKLRESVVFSPMTLYSDTLRGTRYDGNAWKTPLRVEREKRHTGGSQTPRAVHSWTRQCEGLSKRSCESRVIRRYSNRSRVHSLGSLSHSPHTSGKNVMETIFLHPNIHKRYNLGCTPPSQR